MNLKQRQDSSYRTIKEYRQALVNNLKSNLRTERMKARGQCTYHITQQKDLDCDQCLKHKYMSCIPPGPSVCDHSEGQELRVAD